MQLPEHDLDRRLGRVEDRQADVIIHLNRIDEKLDALRQGQWDLQQKITLSAAPPRGNGPAPSSAQWDFAKAVIYGLLAVVAALGAGKILNLGSLLGG